MPVKAVTLKQYSTLFNYSDNIIILKQLSHRPGQKQSHTTGTYI